MAAYGMAYYENLKLINTIKNVKNNMDGYKADIKWSELGFAPALPNAMYYAENAI